jgi:hypothetical protein
MNVAEKYLYLSNKMKTKIYSSTFFAITFLCVSFFSNCQKQNPCGTPSFTTYNISAIEKSEIPYAGNETLVFVSNTGDTAKLIGQGKLDYYHQDLIAGDPECQSSGTNYERIRYLFKGTIVNLSNITIYTGIYDALPPIGSAINISINDITIRKDGVAYISDSLHYSDTMYLGNKLYHGLILYSNDFLNTVFYRYPEGILRIKFSNGQTWLKQ